MKKVFIPEIVTKTWLPGHPKPPKPMSTTGTWSGNPLKNRKDNLDKTHFLPMIREVYPSCFEGEKDPEVSHPVLMKNTKRV